MENKKIPICAGENLSLSGKEFWQSGLEKNYLEGKTNKLKYITRNFVPFFKRVCGGMPVTLLAWAPLTNIAKLLLKSTPKIEKIIWTGGSLSWSREHNLNSDIEAAKIVFNSSIPLRIIPKEVTHQFFIERNELYEIIKNNRSPLLSFLFKRFDEWLEFIKNHKEQFSFEFPPNATFIHDYLTVASLLKPDLFYFQKMKLKIKNERLVEENGGKKVEVCIGFKNKEKVKRFLLDTLVN
jgi:inosine-uridine nucleoside N-ribohydrolase